MHERPTPNLEVRAIYDSNKKRLNIITNVITFAYIGFMIKSLTSVGNSKAIILPKSLIDKYQLDKVTIHEVDQGILIKPVSDNSSFHEKVVQLKKRKQKVYINMKAQAETPETVIYYENEVLPDVDLDILEL